MYGPYPWRGVLFLEILFLFLSASLSAAHSGNSDLLLAAGSVAVPSINVGSGFPNQLGQVPITVTLSTQGNSVGGLQHTIVFNNNALSLSGCEINPALGPNPEGHDCALNPAAGPCKSLIQLSSQCGTSPQPFGCPEDADSHLSISSAMVAAVNTPNLMTIPEGVVYTCTFVVTDLLALPTTLQNTRLVASEPAGHQLCSWLGSPCEGTDGVIALPPTPTATPTLTATPTTTPSATSTNTATATATPSDTAAATATPSPTASPAATATSTDTPTATSTATPTATSTATPTATSTATASATPTSSPTPTRTPACLGDCNGDGQVTVDEILMMVNIALGNSSVLDCVPGDQSGNGTITVDEILLAVNKAMSGCLSL